jgi:DNA-binding MarR family transcriptional regulator
MSTVLKRELRQTAPFDSLEQEVFILLQMANHRVVDPWACYLRRAGGLTPNQYNVLRILRGAGAEGLPSGEIVSRMVTRDPDVTRLVDRLVDRRLARRGRTASDRRVVRVTITPAGLELLATLDPAVAEAPRRLLGPVGRRRLAALRDLLEEIVENRGAFPAPATHTTGAITAPSAKGAQHGEG